MGVVKQSIHPCYLLLQESGVIGENSRMVVQSPEREKRQMVLPGDSCSSQDTPTVQAPVLLSLPPSGLLEGLPLSPSFPESCVLTLEALGALSAQDGSFEHLAYPGDSFGSVVMGCRQKVNKSHVFVQTEVHTKGCM